LLERRGKADDARSDQFSVVTKLRKGHRLGKKKEGGKMHKDVGGKKTPKTLL